MLKEEMIKKEDLCIIPWWLPTVQVKNEKKGKMRKLKPTEIIILSKLYGFCKCVNGECKCTRGYLASWANVDEKTVTNALNMFESNNLIKKDGYFDRVENKRKNKYKINKSEFQKYIDNFKTSSSLVKEGQCIIINRDLLMYQVENNLHSHKFLLHALINRFSCHGFHGSRVYIQHWMGEVNKEGITKHMRYLLDNHLIEFVKSKHTNKACITSYSKSHPVDWEILDRKNCTSPGNDKDNFSTESGKNYKVQDTFLPSGVDKISQLKTTKDYDKEVGSTPQTASPSASTPTLSWNYCLSKVLSLYQSKDEEKENAWGEFITGKRFKEFIIKFCKENRGMSKEEFEGFINYLYAKFVKKDNATPYLFLHMMANDLSEYMFQKAPEKKESENIKEYGICPCCGSKYIMANGYGRCSNCELEERDMENLEAVERAKRYYFASDEEKRAMDDENKAELDNLWKTFSMKRCV